jgi:transcription antitermination protein NusB
VTKLSEFPWEQAKAHLADSELTSEDVAQEAAAPKPKSKSNHPPRRPSPKKRWRWARERAVQALYQQILNHTPVDLLDAQFMEDAFMLKVDLELFRRIVRGVSANEESLDAAYSSLLDRPLAEVDPIEQAILRLGAFELIHTPEIPRAVAINEAVEMAKLYGATESHKYINGVLDKLADRVRLDEPRR